MPDRSNLVYRYDGTYQGFLCCVAQCFFHKKLPQGVQLLDEPQGTLFGVQAVESDPFEAAGLPVKRSALFCWATATGPGCWA